VSKKTQAFYEQLKAGEPPGLAESLREAGAALKELGGQIWDAGKPLFDHGRTEAAAALFSGHAHVMYMHGQQPSAQGQEQAQPIDLTPQQELDGREM
jgi:hypothetical protein